MTKTAVAELRKYDERVTHRSATRSPGESTGPWRIKRMRRDQYLPEQSEWMARKKA